MPKFVIEREIPGAGNLSAAELREIARKSVSVIKGMGPRFSGCKATLPATKFTASISLPMKPRFASTRNAAGFPPIAFPPCAA
jgi:hypothetical protein